MTELMIKTFDVKIIILCMLNLLILTFLESGDFVEYNLQVYCFFLGGFLQYSMFCLDYITLFKGSSVAIDFWLVGVRFRP